MPWTRTGDNAATYPALMQLRGHRAADDRLVNEVYGFVTRCYHQSAGHMTDYSVDYGTAEMIGGPRTDALIKWAERAEIFIPRKPVRGIRSWVLLQDPEFIHIKLRSEIEWDRTQRRDTRDPALTVPVRRRDGDNCRWCGVLVQWRGKPTNRKATFDHLVPGEAGTVETMIVACTACNSGRGGNVERWDDEHELRPEPAEPNYGKWTAAFLSENGYPTEPNIRSDERTAPVAGADSAPERVRPATPPSDDPARRAPGPATPPEPSSKSTSGSVGTSKAGSGRDGEDSRTTHLPGEDARPTPPPDQPSAPRPRRRGRRGGRPRPPEQGETR